MTKIMNINTLTEVAEVLENAGYVASLNEHSVAVSIGGHEHLFPVVITLIEGNQLKITCQVAKASDIPEENGLAFALGLLDLNTHGSVLPFAFGIITPDEDESIQDESDCPIVLIDTMPVGDLDECELLSEMEELLTAIIASKEVLTAGVTA